MPTWWMACDFSHVYSLWILWQGMRLSHALVFHMPKPRWKCHPMQFFLKRGFIIRAFSLLELLIINMKKAEIYAFICIFCNFLWKKCFFLRLLFQFSLILFKDCFYFSSICCLYYTKGDTGITPLLSLLLP